MFTSDEWAKKMRYIYTEEYCSAVKQNGIMPFAATGMNRETAMQNEGRQGLPQRLSGKESACSTAEAGDAGLTPGSGGSPGGGHGNPLQYSHLANPMDTGAWRSQSIIAGLLVGLQSQTRLTYLSTHAHMHEVQTEKGQCHMLSLICAIKKKRYK